MNDKYEAFNLVSDIKKRTGWTWKEVAKKFGTIDQTIYAWKRGKDTKGEWGSKPSALTLKGIKTRYDELLEEINSNG